MVESITNRSLPGAKEKIKQMTPLPMNTMLEKESRDEAIKKHAERQSMVTKDVPPTNQGILLNNWFKFFSHLVMSKMVVTDNLYPA